MQHATDIETNRQAKERNGRACVRGTNERRCSDEEAAVVDRPSHELCRASIGGSISSLHCSRRHGLARFFGWLWPPRLINHIMSSFTIFTKRSQGGRTTDPKLLQKQEKQKIGQGSFPCLSRLQHAAAGLRTVTIVCVLGWGDCVHHMICAKN